MSSLSSGSGESEEGRITSTLLISRAAEQIEDILNELRRNLEATGDRASHASGTLKIALRDSLTNEHNLVVHAETHDDGPWRIDVETSQSRSKSALSAVRDFTQRGSDADLERDLVSRKRKRLDEGQEEPHRRTYTGDEEDMMPLITKEDFEDTVAKLRDDIQEDTSDCVNHVHKLLRRFKQEWQSSGIRDPAANSGHRNAISSPPSAAFPHVHDNNKADSSISSNDFKLISTQIRWLEDCRRIATATHEKREDAWRTSSASFHDKARLDREAFQARMLHDATVQGQQLDQILSEVKAIGLYAQSMKWETPAFAAATTPASQTPGSYAATATPPFPMGPQNTSIRGMNSVSGRGRGRGTGT